jgi:hypothetical protein
MNKIVISLLIAITLVLGIVVIAQPSNVNLGSVDGVYAYKNITATNASTTDAVTVRGGAGVLGSVVVLKTSATALGIYDGTSTTTGMTLIGTLPASIAAGTYTFDVSVFKGVVLGSAVGFDGDYVITTR